MQFAGSSPESQLKNSPNIRAWYDFFLRFRRVRARRTSPRCGPLAQLAEQQTLNLGLMVRFIAVTTQL